MLTSYTTSYTTAIHLLEHTSRKEAQEKAPAMFIRSFRFWSSACLCDLQHGDPSLLIVNVYARACFA